MKSKVNPVAIGVFVLGSLTIALAAVMMFGAAKFFKKTEVVTCYFSESVNGLDVGAPVKYKGVTIGKVNEINILVRSDSLRNSRVVVYLSLDMDTIKKRSAGFTSSDVDGIYDQIKDGLRAKLSFLSVVTGMLYVELDYFAQPGDKYRIVKSDKYINIPTVSTGFAEMTDSLQKVAMSLSQIDFKGIGTEMFDILKKANLKLDDMDVKTINENLVVTLKNLKNITSSGKLNDAIENLNKLMVQGGEFLDKTSSSIDEIKDASKSTMAKADNMLDNINKSLSPQSPFMYNMSFFIKNMNDTSVVLKNLMEFLDRNPNSIITGRAKD